MATSPATSPFDQLDLDQLRQRTSAKWQVHPDDVLPLWVAEMDVLPPPAVVAAVEEAMRIGDTGYAMEEPYVEALQAFAAARWGWAFEAASATPVADVMRGAMEAIEQVVPAGGPVIVSTPVYPPFFPFIAHAGRRVVEAPLGQDGRLDLDVLARSFEESSAAEAARPGRAAYLLCNPQNPTGTVHTREELTAVRELAVEHDVRVVADEIHAPLTLPGATFIPYLTVAGDTDAVAVHSASKGWNLPGLKAAVAVFGDAARDDLDRLPEIVPHGASHLGVIAHSAALRDGGTWLDEVIAAIATNRHRFADRVAARLPGARYQPGEATYLAWVDLRGSGLGDHPAGALLERGRVAVVDGPEFGTGGDGHVRVNLATSTSILEEAVDRMATAIG
jgi:cysteine-S-conjugate beta-lyase